MTSTEPPEVLDPSAPGELEPLPPAPPRVSIPTWIPAIAGVFIFVLVAGWLTHVPYYALGPGPSRDVLSLIKINDASPKPSRGKLLLTTASVSDGPVSVWGYAQTLVDPNVVAVPRGDIVPPGISNQQQDAENFRDMEESKVNAEIAAFNALGMTVTRIPGARILTVLSGAPADGKLKEGDLVVAVDGTRISDPQHAAQLMRNRAIGASVRLTIVRDGATRDVSLVTRASIDDPKRPAVGVTLANAYRLPRNVEIDTADIGGPSGGLVFALSIVDALSPEDLTHGHTIAVTGTISMDAAGVARVGDIGAIEEKVRSATAVGADLFIVPADQAAAARKVAPKSLRVVGVGTLQEALAVLRALPPAGS